MQTITDIILERGTKFLEDPKIKGRMDAQTQKDLDEGTKEVYLADFYLRKKLSGAAGTIDLVKATDDRKVGVTNLDKGNLPQSSYMAVCAVGLGYGYAAAATDTPAEVRYTSSEYLNTIPTKLMNCEFTLLNGDKIIIRARTSKFFANAYSDYGVGANDENAVMLPTPKLATWKKPFKAQLEFGDDNGAITLTGNNSHYIEVRILGVYIGDRTN